MRKYIPTVLFVCSALLVIGFVLRLYFDYTLYYEFGSVPFWVYILERFVEYMLAAIGCLAVGAVLNRKRSST